MELSPSPKRSRAIFLMLGGMLGGLGVGLPCLFFMFATQYHYYQESTFFQAHAEGAEVQGIAFMDYHGFGFMEGIQWKVQLVKPNEPPVLLYQNRSRFQEALPRQPEVVIEGGQVKINDGLNKLMIVID